MHMCVRNLICLSKGKQNRKRLHPKRGHSCHITGPFGGNANEREGDSGQKHLGNAEMVAF